MDVVSIIVAACKDVEAQQENGSVLRWAKHPESIAELFCETVQELVRKLKLEQ